MTHINSRRDTTTGWNAQNPVLMLGEMGVETDADDVALALKVGDGEHQWTALPYFFEVPDLSVYAPKASPAFTGHPTAPTPSIGSDDFSVATTEFVAGSLAPFGTPIGTTPPSSPLPGQRFYHSTMRAEFIWRGSYWMLTDVAGMILVDATTTGNITLSGTQVLDGFSAGAGSIVLVKNQADTTKNGIWVVQTGAWTRAVGFDGALFPGCKARVINGTAWAYTEWTLSGGGAAGSYAMYWTLTGGDTGFIAVGGSGAWPTTWLNGWTDYATGWQTVYRRLNGIAYVQIMAKGGVVNTPYLVLPPGFRPGTQLPLRPVVSGGAVSGCCYLGPAGSVYGYGTAGNIWQAVSWEYPVEK